MLPLRLHDPVLQQSKISSYLRMNREQALNFVLEMDEVSEDTALYDNHSVVSSDDNDDVIDEADYIINDADNIDKDGQCYVLENHIPHVQRITYN